MLWFWGFVGPALLLAALSRRGDRRRGKWVRARLAERAAEAGWPAVTLIVPVKGVEEGLAGNLRSLARLDYPDFELIVVAREAEDIPRDVIPPEGRVVIAGPGDAQTGEKVQNLMAGVRAARPASAVFAFADSDGLANRGWLRALVRGLDGTGVGVATGYRWHVPRAPGFWPLLRSVWNAVIAGGFGPGANRFVWGGAMAIRRETFQACRVPEYWRGAVSDDYALAAAVRRAGLTIAYAPGALTADTSGTNGRDCLAWTRRQMILTRVHRPDLWRTALAAHIFYCGSMVVCVAAALHGYPIALVALAAQLGVGMTKGRERARLARFALPAHEDWFRRLGWIHTWGTPLATWLWLYSLAASAGSNEIQWRGRRYRLTKIREL